MRKHNYTYRKYACADCILVQVVVAGNFRRWSGLISRTVHAIELISWVGDNPRNLDPQNFPAIRVFSRFLFPHFPISSFLISCSSFYTDPVLSPPPPTTNIAPQVSVRRLYRQSASRRSQALFRQLKDGKVWRYSRFCNAILLYKKFILPLIQLGPLCCLFYVI